MMEGRSPKFGDRMRGIHASESNPIRDGFYIKTVRRTGSMNKGTFYQLTNGKGKFWEYPAESVVFLDENWEPTTTVAGGE